MENLSDEGIRVRQGKSPKALGEKFEKFIDYTKGQKIFLSSFSQKEKGVDCHKLKNGIP